MTSGIDLGPLRWWDIPAARALEERLFPHDAWSPEQFWSEIAQPTRRYLAAREGERLVGYAGMFVMAPDADVQTVAVDPDCQGRGIASELLSSLLATMDDSGVTHTLLEVRDDNVVAMSLYSRLGFEEISRRPRYYADGVDAVIMRRPRPGHGSGA